MAEEITLNAALEYEDSEESEITMQTVAFRADVATKKFVHVKQSIGTSEEALVLGEVSSPGWAFFTNHDDTNYIELRVETGGAKFAKLLPGESCVLRLGSGVTAPYAIANTAACQLEYLIVMT